MFLALIVASSPDFLSGIQRKAGTHINHCFKIALQIILKANVVNNIANLLELIVHKPNWQ